MIWFAVAGFAFGLLGGMGMGGGVILIPVLTLLLGVAQKEAQAYNLLAFLPMAIFALVLHFKAKRIDWKLALGLCLAGAPLAAGGALLAGVIGNAALKVLFGAALTLLGLRRAILQLRRLILSKKK